MLQGIRKGSLDILNMSDEEFKKQLQQINNDSRNFAKSSKGKYEYFEEMNEEYGINYQEDYGSDSEDDLDDPLACAYFARIDDDK